MKKLIIALVLLCAIVASCKKSDPLLPVKATYPFKFNTVAILGNSITFSPQNLFGGWNGNWGMAATARDLDYVHLLIGRMQTVNPTCQVAVKNIMAFEENWNAYNLSSLDSIKNLHPDLVILRIGEDVPRPFDKEGFSRAYKALVDYFGPKTVVLGVGSFWPRQETDEVMSKYAAFVSLAPLGKDMGNYSLGAWSNPGICQHPNDKGMGQISDLIWQTVQQLKPAN